MEEYNIYDYLSFSQLLNRAKSDVNQLGGDIFQKAQYNDAQAFYEIGNAYLSKGIINSTQIAFSWLKRAASLDHPRAKYLIGTIYHQGLGVSANYAVAMQYYTEAAKFDVPEANYNIGYMYENGQSVPKNNLKAFEYFQQAANLGYLDAYHIVGMMYFNGIGVQVDVQKALEWFTEAAKQGNEESRLQVIELNKEGYYLSGEKESRANAIQTGNKKDVNQDHGHIETLIQKLISEFEGIQDSNCNLKDEVKKLQDQINDEIEVRKKKEASEEDQKKILLGLKTQIIDQQKIIQTLQDQLYEIKKIDQQTKQTGIDERFGKLETKLEQLELSSKTSYQKDDAWNDPNYDST